MARRKLSKRETVMFCALGIVALSVVYYGMSDRPSVQTLNENADGEIFAPDQAPVVHLASLTADPEPYDPAGRDLFKYSDRPLTPDELEARRRAEEERLRRLAEEAARRKKLDETRAAKAPRAEPKRPGPTGPIPPRLNMKYLGYFGPKDAKIAVFEDGDELVLAQTGETFREDFFVKEIDYQVVIIGFTKPEFQNRTTELSMAKAR